MRLAEGMSEERIFVDALGYVAGPYSTPLSAPLRGWLGDIERALRDVFTSSSDEDEAFDNATVALDALREYLEAGRVV